MAKDMHGNKKNYCEYYAGMFYTAVMCCIVNMDI